MDTLLHFHGSECREVDGALKSMGPSYKRIHSARANTLATIWSKLVIVVTTTRWHRLPRQLIGPTPCP